MPHYIDQEQAQDQVNWQQMPYTQDQGQEQGQMNGQNPAADVCKAPCQNPAVAQEEANKEDSCDAKAYCQATKVTKLRPIAVVFGLVVVSVLAVSLLNSSKNEHSNRGCRSCKSCKKG